MPVEKAIAEGLNAQLGRELAAHLQYLSIAAYFDAEALPQLAAFFDAQAQEEHDHAMRFMGYIRDVSAQLTIPELAPPQAGFESAEEAVALSLSSEQAVTGFINDLTTLAEDHRDHATRTFLQWFVTEQIEEVSTMSDLLTVVQRAGATNLLLVEDYVARGGNGEGPAPAG